MRLTKREINVLVTLKDENCFSKIQSLSINDISEKSDAPKPTVRAYLKTFLLQGLVEEGAKDWNSKTYYITKLGLDVIEEYYDTTNVITESDIEID